MAESTGETLKEIEEIRERMQAEVGALEDRLPKPPGGVRGIAGAVVAAGAGLLVLKAVARRRKNKKTARIQQKLESAREKVPEQVRETLDEADWRAFAIVAGAAGLLFRLVELRQLRRINKALRR